MILNTFTESYNPDVLSCLANLSNDEVFTPPAVVNQMLDMLPKELWSDKNARFLDPACKSGVFLREIAKRLLEGLKGEIPDLQERIDHIFQKQLYGIAITELTSLLSRRSVYCSKYPNSKFSVSKFKKKSGNIRFENIKHTWKKGRCIFCGASQGEYEREDSLETHAYELIHTDSPKDIFAMKFDVIIGNPPYQLSDGGAQASATPIYNKFVEQAKKLNPRYLCMIIPSRWFSGGRGLDKFRMEMINDHRIRVLHDFLNASECFGTGIEIKGGVCFFLWNRDEEGTCNVVTHNNSKIHSELKRFLCEKDADILIRWNEAVPIYKKIKSHDEETFDTLVSAQKPFGLRTFVRGKKVFFDESIHLFERGGTSYIKKEQVLQNKEWIDAFKIYISSAYNAGDVYPHQIINKPLFGGKGTCCTETYLVIGPFTTKEITFNVLSYIETKLFRFLVSLRKISQHAAQKVYTFVPVQDFSKPWTDEELYAKYDLSDKEIAFIESMIRPMELNGDNNDE